MRTVAVYGVVAAILTTLLILFITLGDGVQYARDAIHDLPRPHHQSQSSKRPRPDVSHDSVSPPAQKWDWDYKRDRRNYGLSSEKCAVAFPTLDHEVQRAVTFRQRVGPITPEELEVGWRGDGIVRALIHDNALYVIDAHGVWDHNHRPRAIATLHSINRALSATSEPLPTIEFTFTVHDAALVRPDGNHTTWAFSRRSNQETLWLMPDFGFWGWPDVGLRSYTEFQAMLEADEDDFLDKVPKIVWRGSLAVGSSDARQGLVHVSKNQPWSDVQTLDWSNKTDIDTKLLTMEDHCGYMFTAQTEGNSYSGRMKYLMNCHSVALVHELHWIEHYHHLLQSDGPHQNYMQFRRDFSDLPRKMKNLVKTANVEKVRAVADNARSTFRERYLTPAAEACYWRSLIRGWAEVQGFEPEVFEDRSEGEEEDWRGGKRSRRRFRGTPFEAFAIMEEVEWELPAKARKMCIEE